MNHSIRLQILLLLLLAGSIAVAQQSPDAANSPDATHSNDSQSATPAPPVESSGAPSGSPPSAPLHGPLQQPVERPGAVTPEARENPHPGRTAESNDSTPEQEDNPAGDRPSDNPKISIERADTRPVAGIEEATVGLTQRRRNLLVPYLSWSESLDTNPFETKAGTEQRERNLASSVTGRMLLELNSRRRMLAIGARAGGTAYRYNTPNTALAQFDIGQTYFTRRWSFTVRDSLAWSRGSSSGLAILSQSDLPTYRTGAVSELIDFALPPLSPAIVPQSTALIGNSRQLSNTVATQAAVNLTSRVTFTAAGAYGLLHYTTSGLHNFDQIGGLAGLEYAFTGRDRLGVLYDATVLHSSSFSNIKAHGIQVAYSRRVTGRLSWRASVGPQLWTRGTESKVLVSTRESLDWQGDRTRVSLSYFRGVTGGSGVLPGATTDSLSAALDRQLSRVWSAGGDVGYTRDRSLDRSSNYRMGSATGRVGRTIGPTLDFFIQYGVQQQSSLNCATCAGGALRQIAGFGLTWHPHPVQVR